MYTVDVNRQLACVYVLIRDDASHRDSLLFYRYQLPCVCAFVRWVDDGKTDEDER